jgi:thiol-disulfide isomerase/thioredoxin
MKSKTVYIYFGILILLFVGIFGYSQYVNSLPGKYDDFAVCLKDKGATFYGAFWCPHCQAQKDLFGRSEKHLPYVECSTPDGQGQLQVCIDKEIKGYPTWEFADGSRLSSEQSLEILAGKTGCMLPEGMVPVLPEGEIGTSEAVNSTATSSEMMVGEQTLERDGGIEDAPVVQ